MTDLSIVIVNWNGRGLLLDCLASIEREVRGRADAGRISSETLVVDQASSDGSAAAVREAFPWAELIELPGNVGFAAGNNQALALARGRRIVLLNNDTIVTEGWLGGLEDVLDAHPGAGIAGPVTNYASGPQVLFPHVYGALEPETVVRVLPFPARADGSFALPSELSVTTPVNPVVQATQMTEETAQKLLRFIEETDPVRRLRASQLASGGLGAIGFALFIVGVEQAAQDFPVLSNPYGSIAVGLLLLVVTGLLLRKLAGGE